MESRSEELERYKRIDLVAYASTRGYVVDRKASSRHSTVMRHSNGDKLGISKAPSGVFMFYNYKGSESGTIIDLVQAIDGGTLGDVRKTLRRFDGSVVDVPSSTLPFPLQPSQHDASQVLDNWMKAKPIGKGHPYLTMFRGISETTQSDPIFKDRIRIDQRGNMVVPHYNRSGLCGFELKNGNQNRTTFTGFSPGGIKALACSRPRDTDTEMVICETAVDMFSLAELEGTENRRFFSTAGQISAMQAECLRSAAQQMPPGSRILLALDNDEAGRNLAQRIRAEIDKCGLPIEDYFPNIEGADWNDVLSQSRPSDEPIPRLD